MTDELPELNYTVPLPYLKIEEMHQEHSYIEAQIHTIQTMQSKFGLSLKVIFKFNWVYPDNRTEIKYVNYLCSTNYSENTKIGELILMVMKQLPKKLNLNDFLAKSKFYWFKIFIEQKNNYPTVTKIVEVSPVTEPLESVAVTLDSTPGPVQPEVKEPELCFYCNKPLPPNTALHTPIAYNNTTKYLCPNCKEHAKEFGVNHD